MHKHTAVQLPNGSYALSRDGLFCQCPKTMIGMPVPNNVANQIDLKPVRMECTTICPFATIVKGDTPVINTGGELSKLQPIPDKYVIACEGNILQIPLEEITKYQKNPLIKGN